MDLGLKGFELGAELGAEFGKPRAVDRDAHVFQLGQRLDQRHFQVHKQPH